MKLYSGTAVNAITLMPQQITIDDIAHSLSQQCRFIGHTLRHYSVAQHCVLVSRTVHPDIALEGLMHDAEEAYTGDMIKDLKHGDLNMADFIDIGHKVSSKIFLRFGLKDDVEVHKAIKEADNYIVELEKKCLFKFSTSTVIGPWPAEVAEKEFLARFTDLFRLRSNT